MNLVTLEFLSGYRSYIAMAIFVVTCFAGWFGVPLAEYGLDMTPNDPATVAPEPGTALTMLLAWLGLYKAAKKESE